eukprot:gnl/MRDRNA2_/MRDRNA2_31546_c0_seq1.p1 gnl/MRDRNA2_/MRDRNA2_31546_c0~~gnl/MRDRNA2_/MRDRNA2_31546_c0_seq1.p1  ORF type:complete len:460 (-),score=103.88 gnl/MRDRNA2_/MRDRNA2_31546_c0_seq1:129-1508(-)
MSGASSFFAVTSVTDGKTSGSARCGQLLQVPTPNFTLLTSRGLPLHMRPEMVSASFDEGKLLAELPIGDLILRRDLVAESPKADEGCSGLWPYLGCHIKYLSFRNALQNPSVYGGDAVVSVETFGGRRKVPVKVLLDLQSVMKCDVVALPGEEVGLEDGAHRRLHRAVTRADEWLEEVLKVKAADPNGKKWHVLASIQGGKDLRLRQRACERAASKEGIGGFWLGGFGYGESLPLRAEVLQGTLHALPHEKPRFLPLCVGTPVEILQAVLLGVDVVESPYPAQAAGEGVALTFAWKAELNDLPSEAEAKEILKDLLKQPVEMEAGAKETEKAAKADEEGASSQPLPIAVLKTGVRHLRLRTEEFREDFGPISENTPVSQYSRAYLFHLLMVRELLGTMLLMQHNLHAYAQLFKSIRGHIEKGTIQRFAAWFLQTQTSEDVKTPSPAPLGGRPSKKQRKL